MLGHISTISLDILETIVYAAVKLR
jgi:hypothetical protein